jgi:hypothetical protein
MCLYETKLFSLLKMKREGIFLSLFDLLNHAAKVIFNLMKSSFICFEKL